jgi:hypothetical protein
MPIRSNLGGLEFTPEQVAKMQVAFDQAWGEFAPAVPTDLQAARNAIAIAIVQRASAGAYDDEGLLEAARAAALRVQTNYAGG